MNTLSMEDRAGAFLDAAAAAGDIRTLTLMSLLFPSARGEKHHERALKTAMQAGQLQAAETLVKAGVEYSPRTHQPYNT
jgi:uncharacterized protein YggE